MTKGQTLITVEAMKMETAVTAPEDGVIKEIHVEEGSAVKGGQLLITLA